uniref:Capsid protein n=1 Tax=Nebet virus TaxID=2800930 RepID=A0A894KIW7_9VIRU|nr:MAG: capsid protein [Nebet virus]
MANNATNVRPNDRGLPGRIRPPRARDVQRMANFRENVALRNGSWAESQEQHDIGEQRMLQARPPQNRRRGTPRPQRPEGIPAPSTVETPPNDGILYDGNGSGSAPTAYQSGHNLDYAGFLPVLEETYRLYEEANPTFARSVPYCAFQHVYTEVLNASILSQAKKRSNHQMAFHPDPLQEGQFEEVNVPLPIKKYIEGATETISSSGELVKMNVPTAGFPRAPADEMSSGHFGQPDAEGHNAYECYVSPYITRRLIERTVEANSMPPGGNAAAQQLYRTRFDDWNPFPVAIRPLNGTPNLNLLGYRRPERLRTEAQNLLDGIHFYDDETILGRIAHCPELVNRVSAIVGRETRIKSAKCAFKYDSGTATLLNHELVEIPPAGNRVADMQTTITSAFSFSATDSNKSNYFGYTRTRTEEVPGLCFTFIDNVIPGGWVDSRNANLLMTGTYAGVDGIQDDAMLRLRKHREQYGAGTVHDALNRWLYRHFTIDARK